MSLCTATFELGTLSSNVLAADPGAATAWDSVVLGTGASFIYDNTHVAEGAQSCKMVSGSSGASYLQWLAAHGTTTNEFGRAYIYMTANPAGTFNFLRMLHAGSLAAGLAISSTGKLIAQDTTGNKATGAVSIGLNQWVRIEWQVVASATVGNVIIWLYNTAGAPIASFDEQIGNGGNYNTSANFAEVRVGAPGATTGITMWYDAIGVGAGAQFGPAGAAPVVSVAKGRRRRRIGPTRRRSLTAGAIFQALLVGPLCPGQPAIDSTRRRPVRRKVFVRKTRTHAASFGIPAIIAGPQPFAPVQDIRRRPRKLGHRRARVAGVAFAVRNTVAAAPFIGRRKRRQRLRLPHHRIAVSGVAFAARNPAAGGVTPERAKMGVGL